jgi:ankyrin repeat protein
MMIEKRMVEILIAKGANVNNKNESGKTALMLAAFSGKLNVIKELVNNGASYDLKDNSGCTVLHYAVGKHLQVITKLIPTLIISFNRRWKFRLYSIFVK